MVHKLRDHGWTNVHPTTISRIEKRERPVKLAEAARIANVLGTDLSRMLARPDRAGAEEELDKVLEGVTDAYNRIGEGAYWLSVSRTVLQTTLAEFRGVVDRENDDYLREKLRKSQRYLGLRIDNAVRAGRAASTRLDVWGPSDFIKQYGASPDRVPDVSRKDINAPEA